MTRFQVAAGIVGALTVAFILGYLWFRTSTMRWDSPDIAFCRDLYAVAHTQADSMRVDATIRANQGNAQAYALNCGALRSAYPTLFTHDGAR